MARLPRYFVPDHPLHVIQRGNNRSALFFVDPDYGIYLRWLTNAARQHRCAIHAYVLMTNHVHLLVTPQHATSLANTMQSLGRRYVQHVNRRYQRTGTLWEGRYKATLIDSEQYLLTCCRYVELNPVRAGMVTHPGEYPWSSYLSHAEGRADPVLTAHPLYVGLGATPQARQAAYRELFTEELGEERLKAIREATNKAWVLGSDRFKEQIAAMVKRRITPFPKGRHRQAAD